MKPQSDFLLTQYQKAILNELGISCWIATNTHVFGQDSKSVSAPVDVEQTKRETTAPARLTVPLLAENKIAPNTISTKPLADKKDTKVQERQPIPIDPAISEQPWLKDILLAAGVTLDNSGAPTASPLLQEISLHNDANAYLSNGHLYLPEQLTANGKRKLWNLLSSLVSHGS